METSYNPHPNISFKPNPPSLPLKLSIGYADNNQCDDKIFQAVENGLNVIIWFSVVMQSNPVTGLPEFFGGPDFKCVAQMVHKISSNGYKVIHLLSVGGWNRPHPDTSHSAQDYLTEWLKFNKKISNDSLGFYGFDGLDWDCEGHDDFSLPINHFTFKELDLIGEFSQKLKENGYIVSMAPAESYLDYTNGNFSLSLLFNYPEWEKEVPNFTYHGRNVYTYLLKKFEMTNSGEETFDFVSIQLYEGYSHALYKYNRKGVSFGEIVGELIEGFEKGYEVDFGMEKESGMGKEVIKIKKEKIVIGLANAWANDKFLFVKERDILNGYKEVKEKGLDCRGFMFWNINDEGRVHESGEGEFWMAKIMKNMFNIDNKK